jgi:hypothetical protein
MEPMRNESFPPPSLPSHVIRQEVLRGLSPLEVLKFPLTKLIMDVPPGGSERRGVNSGKVTMMGKLQSCNPDTTEPSLVKDIVRRAGCATEAESHYSVLRVNTVLV